MSKSGNALKRLHLKNVKGKGQAVGEESSVTRGNVARSVCGCGLRASLAVRHRAALRYVEHLKRRKKRVQGPHGFSDISVDVTT